MTEKTCTLTFDEGTLIVSGTPDAMAFLRTELTYDERIRSFRAPAYRYEAIMRTLYTNGVTVQDHARNYTEQPLTMQDARQPMKHQAQALRKWLDAKRRGVVVMPTGSGKTFFAFLAMQNVQRSTLIVVPTIDLMQQWAAQLEESFQIQVGMLGGGSKEIRPVTVATYDSAVLRMNTLGNQFGFIIFDECHHLPGEISRSAASMCIAPFRLGLTATPERNDGGERLLEDLIGKTVCRIFIDELEGTVLSPYITRRVFVPLEPDEAAEYQEARKTYIDFVRKNRIDFSRPDGWQDFMILCARMNGGRAVMRAWLRQREIARCGRAKLNAVFRIIRKYSNERCIVFTADNDTAYRIGEALCLPVLTHKTKAAERKEFLQSFRDGTYPVLVTSRVLNEGVDVPEASIGIVVSGSAGTREHVQRLGRILRRGRDGKLAQLFELVSEGTSEMNVSERRRANRAYDRDFRLGEGGEPC